MSNNPNARVEPNSLGLKDLLCEGFYRIPSNQREYRWQEDQLKKYWDDLLLCVEDDMGEGSRAPLGHFLGAVVVIGDSRSEPNGRWDVIDGQQRLTTSTILARCLLDLEDLIEDRNMRDRKARLLQDSISEPGVGATEYPRIELNHENEFYRALLLQCRSADERAAYWTDNPVGASEVKANIRRAFEFFQQRLGEVLFNQDGVPLDDSEARLVNLVDAFTTYFYALHVRARDEWMAYKLFETLNDRSLELSRGDLIKNVLLREAEELERAEQVEEDWDELRAAYESQAQAGKLALDQIIQFSYTYRRREAGKPTVDQDKLYDYFADDLRDNGVSPIDLSGELARDAGNWADFVQGDMGKWSDDTRDSHYAITVPLWKAHAAPFLFALCDLFGDDLDSFRRGVAATETYLFRQGLICKDSPLSLQRSFGLAAITLRHTRDLGEAIGSLSNSSPDANYLDAFTSSRVSNMKQAYYVMWKIEDYLSRDGAMKPREQSEARHVEHILPRCPGDYWGGVENDDRFKLNLNRLGNLLILEGERNSHIKNRELDFKISNPENLDYQGSGYALPRQLIEKREDWLVGGRWTFESIRLRQEWLRDEYALRVWSFD